MSFHVQGKHLNSRPLDSLLHHSWQKYCSMYFQESTQLSSKSRHRQRSYRKNVTWSPSSGWPGVWQPDPSWRGTLEYQRASDSLPRSRRPSTRTMPTTTLNGLKNRSFLPSSTLMDLLLVRFFYACKHLWAIHRCFNEIKKKNRCCIGAFDLVRNPHTLSPNYCFISRI